MAATVTAYCILAESDVSQIAPPQFTATVQYSLFNSTAGALLATQQSGGLSTSGLAQAVLTPPIASQSAVLAALQAAVQAAEPATPGLAFIWLKL